MSSSADRLAAARLLLRVGDGAYSSRLLGGAAGPGVRTRVLGALRWQRALDSVLQDLSRRPLERLDPAVLVTLRLGLLEAVQLQVPVAVATDGAVHLVRRLGFASAAGLVNAILRRAVPAWHRRPADLPADLRLSHPAWLSQRWCASFGTAAAEQMMAAAQEPAAVWGWFRQQEAAQQLQSAGVQLQPHPWCPGAWSAPGNAPALVAAAGRGEVYIQDPASQLVALLAHRLCPEQARIADLCAAPGGKSALLLALGRPRCLVAIDRHPGRCRLVKSLLASTPASVVCGDATRPPLPAAAWDLVLLDAPCSGTGTLRRHPELRWRLDLATIHELEQLQARMLTAALPLLRPGGIVVYATCSVEPEENEHHLETLPPGVVRQPLDNLLPAGVPWLPTAAGGIRLLPDLANDGFTLHGVRKLSTPR